MARNAYATESTTSESKGMNCSRDKPVSRVRFLSWDQGASPVLFPFCERKSSLESRQPFKLDHYLMNSQHTTIAVFAKELLIIRPKDIMPHRIKILTSFY